MKISKSVLSFIMVVLLMAFGTVAFALSNVNDVRHETGESVSKDEEVGDSGILIPTTEWIIENGYPINEYGETYGPNPKGWLVEPDLILAVNDDGSYGYIRASDMEGARTLEEALNWVPRTSVPTYLHDGRTKVGTFTFSR